MKSKIIVCGLDRAGLKIFCLLRQQGASVVGVNDKPVPQAGDDIIIGDLQASATLLAAGIGSAKTLVLAHADETLNLAILLQARVLNPKIRMINRLFNTHLGRSPGQNPKRSRHLECCSFGGSCVYFCSFGN